MVVVRQEGFGEGRGRGGLGDESSSSEEYNMAYKRDQMGSED